MNGGFSFGKPAINADGDRDNRVSLIHLSHAEPPMLIAYEVYKRSGCQLCGLCFGCVVSKRLRETKSICLRGSY